VERAFDPYVDRDLASRVAEAKDDCEEAAQAVLAEQINPADLEACAPRLRSVCPNWTAGDRFSLPPIEVPEP
jgi:hypothetical protein